jgi:hypothetical protein
LKNIRYLTREGGAPDASGQSESSMGVGGREATRQERQNQPPMDPFEKRVSTAARGAIAALDRGDVEVARALLEWLLSGVEPENV